MKKKIAVFNFLKRNSIDIKLIIFNLIAVIFVLALWQALNAIESKSITKNINAQLDLFRINFEKTMEMHVRSLKRMGYRWESQNGMTRQEWEADAEHYSKDIPILKAIEWVDSNLVVRWIVPLQGNEHLLNLDLSFDPKRKEALLIAREQKKVNISQKLDLVDEKGHDFYIVVPLFTQFIQHQFDGFIVALVQIDQILFPFFRSSHLQKDFQLTLYDHNNILKVAVPSDGLLVDQYMIGTELRFGDNEWHIELVPSKSFIDQHQSILPTLVLFSGLFAIALVQYLFYLRRRDRIKTALLNKLVGVDCLTGLANRRCFELSLATFIEHAKRHHNIVSLMFFDIDHFKNINDTLGHSAGDQLLIEISVRVTKLLRDGDLFCRMGGDEFAILFNDVAKPAYVHHLANRIIEVFSIPFNLDGRKISVTTSIGIAIYPECCVDSSQLMKCADVAMYRSKNNGRNQVHFYSTSMHEEVYRTVGLSHDLQTAIERNELFLVYQAIINLRSGKIVGAEVLLRWQHPIKGIIEPSDFISIAEENGQIKKISTWVIDRACSQLHQWQMTDKNLDQDFRLSVNLSAKNFEDESILEDIDRSLTKYHIPTNCFEIEFTETALTKNTQMTSSILDTLTQKGIAIALDDFGTGYSSLTRLKQYPFTTLKIDKTFIQSISVVHGEEMNKDGIFLQGIFLLAKTIGLNIVAEGVETQMQKDWCEELGIDYIQGYYYSKPMLAENFHQSSL